MPWSPMINLENFVEFRSNHSMQFSVLNISEAGNCQLLELSEIKGTYFSGTLLHCIFSFTALNTFSIGLN